MKTIEFHEVDISSYSADQLTIIFKHIQDEIEWHKFDTGSYPVKVHVYPNSTKGYLAERSANFPKTHCTFYLTV